MCHRCATGVPQVCHLVWKPADRPVAFVITAQSGFRASMARLSPSAPIVGICGDLWELVGICTYCTFCTFSAFLYTFGSMGVCRNLTKFFYLRSPIACLPTTFAPMHRLHLMKCIRSPMQGRIHMLNFFKESSKQPKKGFH